MLYNEAMNRRSKQLISFKLFFALLAFAAIVTEIATIIERGAFNLANFLSFFTVENNLLFIVALILGSLVIASGKGSKAFDTFRGFSTAFMLVVGIGFAVLLSGLKDVDLTAVPWDNTVLHYIMPLIALIDYLIDPPKTRLSFKKSLVWILFPAGYFVYSLIRGAVVGWYPYPFLNPNHTSVAMMAGTALGLLIVCIVLIWLVSRLSGYKRAR
jgi:SNF family Na+-dependent transporter